MVPFLPGWQPAEGVWPRCLPWLRSSRYVVGTVGRHIRLRVTSEKRKSQTRTWEIRYEMIGDRSFVSKPTSTYLWSWNLSAGVISSIHEELNSRPPCPPWPRPHSHLGLTKSQTRHLSETNILADTKTKSIQSNDSAYPAINVCSNMTSLLNWICLFVGMEHWGVEDKPCRKT